MQLALGLLLQPQLAALFCASVRNAFAARGPGGDGAGGGAGIAIVVWYTCARGLNTWQTPPLLVNRLVAAMLDRDGILLRFSVRPMPRLQAWAALQPSVGE
jgi:hypothetical protein